MTNLSPSLKKTLLFVCALLMAGCQIPIQELPTPTYSYRPSTPIPTSTLTAEQNPVLKAFKKLEELDAYRLTVTYMKGKEISPRYLFEKKGQGKFRVSLYGAESTYIVVDGLVYKQNESGIWNLDSKHPEAAKEFWWLTLPALDWGCQFDEEYPPNILSISSLNFIETIIVYDISGYVMTNPIIQCELIVDNDGYPRINIREAIPSEYIFVWQFTNFDGEDIAPIFAPTIP